MSLYTKALRHIDMNRVKELREENIKKQKLAEVKFEQEKILAELKKIEAEEAKHINWRRELEEGMTTDSLGMLNLPGDPDTIQTSIPSTSLSSADNEGSPDEDGVVPRIQSFQVVDATKTDTITLTISGSFTTKTIGDSDPINDKVSVGVLVGGTYGGNYLAGGGRVDGLGNGTHTITIPPRFRKAGVTFDVIQITAFDGESGTVNITGAGLKRVNPMNIFVSLDDPEANAFIRDGNFESLSPAEKKKKLEEQLKSSKEYLTKMFGEGMPATATEIADYEPQQSFMDIMVGNQRITQQDGRTINDTTRGIEDGMMDGKPFNPEPPAPPEPPKPPTRRRGYGLTAADIKKLAAADGHDYTISGDPDEIVYDMSDRLGRSNSRTQQAQQTISEPPKPTDDRAELERNIQASLNQLKIDSEQLKGENLRRNINMAIDLGLDLLTVVTLLTPIPGDEAAALSAQAAKAGIKTGAKRSAAETRRLARNFQRANPGKYNPFRSDAANKLMKQQGVGTVPKNNPDFRKPIQFNSYKPDGEVIVEKKKLKSPASLLDKIPGYYDGKPAPLGFPETPPPKMVNGYHPDLVDGKKVANRYNRLDPISAKAMPKTGNPHIDKKVRAAAKKPK